MRHMKNYDIIQNYIKLCKELGRVANRSDVRKCEFLCSPETIGRRFGSFKVFQKQSGIMKNGELTGKILKEELEKRLVWTRITRGRRLDVVEINNTKELPGYSYIKRLYNQKRLSEIWEEVESKISRNILI